MFFSALPHVGASFVPLAIAIPPLFIYLAVLMLSMQKFAIVRAAGTAFALFGAGFLASMKLDIPVAKTRWIDVSLRGVVGALVGAPVAIFLMGEAAPAGLLAGGALIAVGVFSSHAAFPPQPHQRRQALLWRGMRSGHE